MINPIKKKLKEGDIPIIKKKLDGGVVAEANNDGSIYLDKKVKTNSPQAKEAISHEKVHMRQMARGDLNYDDNNVYWKGKKYPREVMNEGSQQLPWETEAYQKQTNMKKSPLKKISIGLSQDVLGQRAGMMEDELKMKADKHAAIGRATAQIAGKVPDKFGGSGQGSWGDPEKGGGQLNPINKNKSPLKATPITATASRSALKITTVASEVAAANPIEATKTKDAAVIENPAGDIAETETQTKDEKKEVDTKEVDTKEEKKEEKKGGAAHVAYSNPSTSFEEGYEKQAAVAKMHKKNKSKSPLKITAAEEAANKKAANTRVSTQLKNINVGETSGVLTSTKTETDTKEEKESVTNFRNACYDEKGNRKAEGSMGAPGIKCSWAKDEDWDPESEYEIKTHVSYDDSYKPNREKTPGTEGTSEEGDQYNMGYHEAMDAKWAAGVKGRGAKKVSRKSQGAGAKYDRMSGRGKTPIGPDGKEMTREDYVTSIAGAYKGNYDQAIGSTKKTTTQITEGTKETESDAKNLAENPNYELNKETGRYEEIKPAAKMGKNKYKSPLKHQIAHRHTGGVKHGYIEKGDPGYKPDPNIKKSSAFKLKGWKAYNN